MCHSSQPIYTTPQPFINVSLILCSFIQHLSLSLMCHSFLVVLYNTSAFHFLCFHNVDFSNSSKYSLFLFFTVFLCSAYNTFIQCSSVNSIYTFIQCSSVNSINTFIQYSPVNSTYIFIQYSLVNSTYTFLQYSSVTSHVLSYSIPLLTPHILHAIFLCYLHVYFHPTFLC